MPRPGAVVLIASVSLSVVFAACSGDDEGSGNSGGSGGAAGGGAGDTGTDTSTEASADAADGSSEDGNGDADGDAANVDCSLECGTAELCDLAHLGLDDDCDGTVDDGCSCLPGTAHSCFAGDPSYRAAAGCHDGTQICTEAGSFGPCVGGVGEPDQCFVNDTSQCHVLTAAPFIGAKLAAGTGSFSADAVPGSEVWGVECPPGVSPCPAVTAPDGFVPLQSGEYSVTYTKSVAGGGSASCKYPLIVTAPGLRIELAWEHPTSDTGVDLDLHLHQPMDTSPWAIGSAAAEDCNWQNCSVAQLAVGGSSEPKWFADPPATPPTPVNWWLDPTAENNGCYYAPAGVGLEWKALAKGCHNPRLDLQNVSCNAALTNPDDPSFCAAENINVDFPPTGQWLRVGVHYYSSHGLGYEVNPDVKIFCDGALAARLGPFGFYSPQKPIAFAPSDGASPGAGNRFWVPADVAFVDDGCGNRTCIVQPIYADATTRTPYFATDTVASAAFLPAYPAPP